MVKKFLFLFVLVLPFSVHGQTGSVVINEIAWPVESAYAADHGLKMGTIVINEVAWMGTPVQNVDPKQWWRYEWLELYNSSDAPAVLDGWAVELLRDQLDFRIPLHGTIESRGYFLIGASDKIQGLDLNYKNLAGKFVNSGQKILLENSVGEIIDKIDARAGWPAGDNDSKRTMERTGVSDTPMWHTSTKAGGTPKAQNSSGVELKLMAQKPVALKPSFSEEKLGFSNETKKDLFETEAQSRRLRGSSFNSSPLFIAVPGAVLAGALALAVRKFLYKA